MTMETYHWERKHLTEPRTTLSIIRTLPEGDWTVRCEGGVLPPEFVTRYETLDAAKRAADDMLVELGPHDCARGGCSEWMPVPPAPPRA